MYHWPLQRKIRNTCKKLLLKNPKVKRHWLTQSSTNSSKKNKPLFPDKPICWSSINSEAWGSSQHNRHHIGHERSWLLVKVDEEVYEYLDDAVLLQFKHQKRIWQFCEGLSARSRLLWLELDDVILYHSECQRPLLRHRQDSQAVADISQLLFPNRHNQLA